MEVRLRHIVPKPHTRLEHHRYSSITRSFQRTVLWLLVSDPAWCGCFSARGAVYKLSFGSRAAGDWLSPERMFYSAQVRTPPWATRRTVTRICQSRSPALRLRGGLLREEKERASPKDQDIKLAGAGRPRQACGKIRGIYMAPPTIVRDKQEHPDQREIVTPIK
ncbi:hypothetical protein BC939DRAFT_436405 [Gamsiella multidivaricata]|uniref:uncharacterized protein n=1 Tax=Gamsiella multidivaricata TaxID=101098 RepID=UPI00221FEE72|nr:uncharacterized protein BC939DRAFT_436405 [Gamsiella multidivaricata]KAI7831752.1 hypothetical protein BC939DRAFT_436405 [Gamsiella multidivaricata]